MIPVILLVWFGFTLVRWRNDSARFRILQDRVQLGMNHEEVKSILQEVGLSSDLKGKIVRRVGPENTLVANFAFDTSGTLKVFEIFDTGVFLPTF